MAKATLGFESEAYTGTQGAAFTEEDAARFMQYLMETTEYGGDPESNPTAAQAWARFTAHFMRNAVASMEAYFRAKAAREAAEATKKVDWTPLPPS